MLKLYLMLLLVMWHPIVYAVTVGKPAPIFSLLNTTGEAVSLFDFRGKHVVLEWFNPDCVCVQRHYQQKTMQNITSQYKGQEVIWLGINSTYYMTTEDNIRWKDTKGLHYRILSDFSGKIARLYQVETTPQMFVINPSGILVYKGAIDNGFPVEQSKFINYVQAALEESLAGKPISYQEAQPYGCLVKYAY